jgi:hypothetical protein
MEVKWIDHKGKKILLIDYHGAKDTEEMISVAKQGIEIERTLTEKILTLADYTDSCVSQEYMDFMKQYTDFFEKINLKSALTGVTGVRKILAKSFLLFTRSKILKVFDTIEEAKDWLVS